MISKEEEIQIAINTLIELIYEMYIKDLKNGNIGKDKLTIKSFGKICNRRKTLNKYDGPNLFNYGK